MSENKNSLNVFGPYQGNDKRKVQRQQSDGTFAEADFRDLVKGDVFKMFESDDEPVDGGRTFTASTDAKPPSLAEATNPSAAWGISVETDEEPRNP